MYISSIALFRVTWELRCHRRPQSSHHIRPFHNAIPNCLTILGRNITLLNDPDRADGVVIKLRAIDLVELARAQFRPEAMGCLRLGGSLPRRVRRTKSIFCPAAHVASTSYTTAIQNSPHRPGLLAAHHHSDSIINLTDFYFSLFG